MTRTTVKTTQIEDRDELTVKPLSLSNDGQSVPISDAPHWPGEYFSSFFPVPRHKIRRRGV